MKMAMLLLLWVTSLAAFASAAPNLPQCPPGTFLSEGRCEECKAGSFTREHSRAKSCKLHSACKTGEKTLRNGTTTSDTACQCADGERDYYVYDPPLLEYRCKPCPPGKSAEPVVGGQSGDTVCCPKGTVAYRDNSGTPSCVATPSRSPTHPSDCQATPGDSPATPGDKLATPGDKPATPGASPTPPKCNNDTHIGNKWRFDVRSFIIGAAVISVCVVVGYCICLLRKTSKIYDVKKFMLQCFTGRQHQTSDDPEASRGLRQATDRDSPV